MVRQLKFENFNFTVEQNKISVEGLVLSAAETAKVCGLVGLASQMSGFNVLPPDIGDPPFTLTFSAGGVLKLSREDSPEGVELSFKTADAFVHGLQESLKTSKDMIQFNKVPGVRGTVDLTANVNDIFEGRG